MGCAGKDGLFQGLGLWSWGFFIFCVAVEKFLALMHIVIGPFIDSVQTLAISAERVLINRKIKKVN